MFPGGKKRGLSCEAGKEGVFGLYVEKTWYRLTIKEEYKSSDPVKNLDVSILQDCLLAPVLGIQNPKEDSGSSLWEESGDSGSWRSVQTGKEGQLFPCILPI